MPVVTTKQQVLYIFTRILNFFDVSIPVLQLSLKLWYTTLRGVLHKLFKVYEVQRMSVFFCSFCNEEFLWKDVCNRFIKDTCIYSEIISIGQVALTNCDRFLSPPVSHFSGWDPDLYSLNAEFESNKLVYAFTDISTMEEMVQCCHKSEGEH